MSFHIIPKQDTREHLCASACWCEPKLLSRAESGGHVVWQHNHTQGLAAPIVVDGLMNSSYWTLYTTENKSHEIR